MKHELKAEDEELDLCHCLKSNVSLLTCVFSRYVMHSIRDSRFETNGMGMLQAKCVVVLG